MSNINEMLIENKGETVVKRKKGRPRKVQNAEEPKIEIEKKKRGRKKKEIVVEEVKPKKKRGRKAAVKYFSSSIRKQIPLKTVFQDNNNYILHLDTEENEGNQDNFNIEAKNMIDKFEDLLITEKGSEISYEEEQNLKDEYEILLQKREKEDKILVEKLEELRNNETFIQSVIYGNTDVHDCPNVEEHEREHVQEMNKKKGFFELLYNFVHNENWLEHTDVNCWWCCHSFSTIPIGVPMDYIDRVKKFRVKGVFCSFACMIAFAKNERLFKRYLIRFFYCKLTGESIIEANLPCAPPRCALKMFGGEMSIEEFRQKSSEKAIYKMIDYPLYISRDYVQEVDTVNMRTANFKVFEDAVTQKVVNLDEKRVKDARLRLSQIEKNTVTIGNTIDKFIKIS
jgi:hypothetical protein